MSVDAPRVDRRADAGADGTARIEDARGMRLLPGDTGAHHGS